MTVDPAMSDENSVHMAHVLRPDGVEPTAFVRRSPTEWTNAEEITIPPGGVLDLGGGHVLANPAAPIEGTLRLEWDE